MSPLGRIDLGDDADNVRNDAARNHVLVGYGAGALAIIDPATKAKIGDIRLKAHPESFRIEGDRVFVNVPDARLIEVADLAKNEAVGAWPTQRNHSNFPMAIDREAHRLFVVFRSPVGLVILSTADGTIIRSLDTCGDADDVVDMHRHRVYVTCGAGAIDVFEDLAGVYQHGGQIPHRPARAPPCLCRRWTACLSPCVRRAPNRRRSGSIGLSHDRRAGRGDLAVSARDWAVNVRRRVRRRSTRIKGLKPARIVFCFS